MRGRSPPAVARQLRERSQETLAPWDTPRPTARPAHAAAARDDAALRASDHLHIAPRSTTEVVDALQARDLVGLAPTPATGAPPWSR